MSGPVFDQHGILTAVVSVSGPANRIGQLKGRHYAPAVTAAAAEIEASLHATRPNTIPVSSTDMSHRAALLRPLEGWLTARRAITASVLSMSAVILVAATPGSPYHPVLPESQGNGPLELLAKLLFLDRLPHGVLIALGFAAMISAGVCFLLVLWAAERGLITTRTVVTLTIAYHAAILLLPLLLSRDVFSYAYYGRILSRYGGNPYVNTPADYPANDLFRFTWPDWRETPSVYGPVFVWMSGAITAVFRSIPDVIVAFRAIAVAASLASVWFVIKTVDQVRPSKTTYAAAMIGLNPVVLFHTVGGGHVDVLVMLGVSAALYLIATDRALPATVALTAAALVKVSAGGPVDPADRLRREPCRARTTGPRAGDPHRDRGGHRLARRHPRSSRGRTPRWAWSNSRNTGRGSRHPRWWNGSWNRSGGSSPATSERASGSCSHASRW